MLSRFLEVPFDELGVALVRLIAFTADHLQRMIAINPGALFNARITATTTAFNAVAACASDEQTKLGVRKAQVEIKESFRGSLPEKVGYLYGALIGKFGPNGPQVTECFPEGRAVFSNCRDAVVEEHLQTLFNGLTAHEGALGGQPKSDAGGLLSTWLAVYGASKSSRGAKTATEESRRTARTNLQLELYRNLLTIGMNYARQPEKLSLFMQQSLLESHLQEETTGEEDAPAAAV